jgi:hypothetical protein
MAASSPLEAPTKLFDREEGLGDEVAVALQPHELCARPEPVPVAQGLRDGDMSLPIDSVSEDLPSDSATGDSKRQVSAPDAIPTYTTMTRLSLTRFESESSPTRSPVTSDWLGGARQWT